MSLSASAGALAEVADPVTDQPLPALFHQLNNQLGIALAHAELLELKVVDAGHRARAEQVVDSVIEAMRTVKALRLRSESAGAL